MFFTLRIDNSRQSAICATLLCSLSLINTISYHILNDSLYFCLSNHINNIMINLIFRKLWSLNQFFDFYFLNMDISLGICFSTMKSCMVGHKILLEGSVSQIFDLGFSFYFMSKKRVTFGHFLKLYFQTRFPLNDIHKTAYQISRDFMENQRRYPCSKNMRKKVNFQIYCSTVKTSIKWFVYILYH